MRLHYIFLFKGCLDKEKETENNYETNPPPCGAGNSRKCPTPGAIEDVPDEFVVE